MKARTIAATIAALTTSSAASSSSTSGSWRNQQPQVEHHADEDEEEPEQDVLEGLDDRLGLVTELRLREQHAREERTDRHRQPERMRRPGAGKHHEHHREGEDLGAAVPRKLVEQRPQQPAAGGQHDQRVRAPRARPCPTSQLADSTSSAIATEVASASSGAKARSWKSTMPSASRECVRPSSS